MEDVAIINKAEGREIVESLRKLQSKIDEILNPDDFRKIRDILMRWNKEKRKTQVLGLMQKSKYIFWIPSVEPIRMLTLR